MLRMMTKLRMSFLKTPSRQGAFLISAAAMLGQGITLILLPIISRIYTPADFAVFGVYAALVGVGTIVATSRLEYAIPLERNKNNANLLGLLVIVGVIFVCSLVAISILLFGSVIAATFPFENLLNYLYLAPLGIALFSIFQLRLYFTLRSNKYTRVAKSRFLQSSSIGILQCSIGTLFKLGIGLGAGQALSHLIGALALIPDYRGLLRRPSYSMGRALYILKRYSRFPLFSMPSALVNAVALRAPAVLIASSFGAREAGSFVFCQSVLSAPVMLLGRSIGQVYISELSKLQRVKSVGALRLFRGLTTKLVFFGVFIGVLLWVVGPVLFQFVFGQNWNLAGVIASSMSLIIAAEIVVIPVTQTLEFLGKQKAQFFWDVSRSICVVLIFMVSGWVELPFLFMIAIYSVTVFIFYGILLVVMNHAVRDYDRLVAIS